MTTFKVPATKIRHLSFTKFTSTNLREILFAGCQTCANVSRQRFNQLAVLWLAKIVAAFFCFFCYHNCCQQLRNSILHLFFQLTPFLFAVIFARLLIYSCNYFLKYFFHQFYAFQLTQWIYLMWKISSFSIFIFIFFVVWLNWQSSTPLAYKRFTYFT